MFLLVPIKTDSPLRTTPWANWLLIGLNVLVFVLEESVRTPYLDNWALNIQRPELYQFVSYSFQHGGVMHLASNMLFLYIFGNNICDKLGNFAYLAFYLAGAVLSGVGYAAINQTGMLVGASGAVAAVTGAYLALMPRSHVTLFYWVFILIGMYELPSMWFILAFFAQDLFYSFSHTSNVAHFAHVGGSIFGFLLSMALLKFRLLPRDHFDMLGVLDRWNRRREYQATVRNGYDPFDYRPGPQKAQGPKPPPLPSVMEKTQELRAEISEAMAHGDLPRAGELYKELRRVDAAQTLGRGAQLDLGNYYYSVQDYADATASYELYLKAYPSAEHAGQVYLMLGLAYGRYMGQPAKAKECLLEAVTLLHMTREQEIAKAELMRLEVQGSPPLPPDVQRM